MPINEKYKNLIKKIFKLKPALRPTLEDIIVDPLFSEHDSTVTLGGVNINVSLVDNKENSRIEDKNRIVKANLKVNSSQNSNSSKSA